MCELGTITRTCGAATPGLAKMVGIDVDDVVSIPLPNSDWTITGNVILKPGKFWKDIPFVEQKAGIEDDIADAVGGGFQKSIPLKLSKYSPQTNKWVNGMIGARIIVVAFDNNDQAIMIGSKTAPVRLQRAKGTSGQKFGDENGWDMVLAAEGVKPCYFYTGTVALAEGGSGTTYDTEIDFTIVQGLTNGLRTGPGGMTVNIGTGFTAAQYAAIKFRYDKILTVTNPDSLTGQIYNGSSEFGRIDARKDYTNAMTFELVMPDGGALKHGIYNDGVINLTA